MSDSSSESDGNISLSETETKSIQERQIVINHLKTYLKQEKDADERLESVELDFKADELVISGKDLDVNLAFAWIKEIVQGLIIDETVIKVSVVGRYFAEKKGIHLIERIAKSCSCTPEIKEQNQLKLQLTTGDISSFQADVIVTSSSPDKLASCQGSATTKALLKQAGENLKVACQTASDPKLQPGDILATNGFKLSCKEVYHVLLSHYNPADGDRLLRKSVKTCLAMAEKSGHSTIAFPTLGAGGFSYPVQVVVKVLEEEVKSFYPVHLNKVFLVVYPAENVFIPRIIHRGGKIKLNVTFGDLSRFQVDVIVTCSSAENLPGCVGSATSRALLEQAGDELQEACEKASNGNHTVGDVIPTPGFNLDCKEVYHVVLDNFDPSSGEQVLKKAITNCLNLAEKSGYRSMAFPALGAGGFQFPPELVVRCLDEVVKKHKGSSLHDIYLVIFPSDLNVAKAAEEVLCISLRQSTLSISKRRKITVFVQQGDITTSNCDVIVNSTNQFKLSGQVGLALVANAGMSILYEIIENPVKSTTNMRITSGGNLCKYILHLNTPTDYNELAKLLFECFCEADALGVESLAMPPVGTGGIGLSSITVAKCLASAINMFDQSTPINLKQIMVYVYQIVMLNDFQREIVDIPTKPLRTFKETVSSPQPLGVEKIVASKSRVRFCSKSKQNTDKAIALLEKKIVELSFTQIIKDEAIKDLTPDEEQELQNLMTSENVLIKYVSSTELKIQGLKTNESSSCLKATQIINEFKHALHILDYVEWWYLHPSDNKKKKFPLRASFELENAYKKNKQGQKNVTVHDTIPNLYLAVDFANMEASTGVSTCKVERRLVAEKPDYWDEMGDEITKQVTVVPNSPEFHNVLQKFRQTQNLNVVQLHRIQNITLWIQFQEQKKKIEKKMPNQPVTRELFHGTDAATSEKISKDTFDRSHAGKNATFYGRGVYFATTAQYSHGFASEDPQGHRRMFLAEVITGTPSVGNKDTHTIPMQADGTPFDSVVDNLQSPNMFVVFRDASVYPMYLLTYKT